MLMFVALLSYWFRLGRVGTDSGMLRLHVQTSKNRIRMRRRVTVFIVWNEVTEGYKRRGKKNEQKKGKLLVPLDFQVGCWNYSFSRWSSKKMATPSPTVSRVKFLAI